MEAVLREVVKEASEGGRIALVTPLETQGSLPTGQDARMMVREDGSSVGTVGGGRMEAEAQRAGQAAAAASQARLIEVSLSADDARKDGLLCGGEVTFLVEPVSDDAQIGALQKVLRLRETRTAGVEAIRISGTGAVHRLVVVDDGSTVGELGREELDREIRRQVVELAQQESRQILELAVSGDVERVFVNPIVVRPTAYIFGAGHVGMAVSQIAPTAGFRVVVIDDRPQYANTQRFPNAESVLVREFENAVESLPIDERSYLVVMTRGHSWDREVVSQALKTRAGYIGMIGSRRKVNLTLSSLKEDGYSDEDVARVHAPIGLHIGSDTPGEIAISVVAEMIQVRRLGACQAPQAMDNLMPWDMILSGGGRRG